jgi:hypothetical protein
MGWPLSRKGLGESGRDGNNNNNNNNDKIKVPLYAKSIAGALYNTPNMRRE